MKKIFSSVSAMLILFTSMNPGYLFAQETTGEPTAAIVTEPIEAPVVTEPLPVEETTGYVSDTGSGALEIPSLDPPLSGEIASGMIKEPSPLLQPALTQDIVQRTERPATNPGEKTVREERPLYVHDEILIKFKPAQINLKSPSGKIMAASFAETRNMESIDTIVPNNIVVMKLAKNETVEQKLTQLQGDPTIEYVEPNYIRYPLGYNDTYSGNLRALNTISRYTGMNMFSGIANTTGTIVAVIDAGVDYNHPDLINNMRDGSSCKDENGGPLGSCLHGYDYMDYDKDPFPVFSDHGTHVAGTIAAEANNGIGIMGVNPHAKIMALRASNTYFTTDAIIKSINFARQNGAKIINESFGGGSPSSGEVDAMSGFRAAGGLFVVAAGNSAYNHEDGTHYSYPCDYTLDNIICVAATTNTDALASYSDYGTGSVDIGAPGSTIYSTTVAINTTTTLNQTFDAIATGSLPAGWTMAGTNANRGVYYLPADWTGVLYGDLANPYNANTDSHVTTGFDLSAYSGVTIAFRTQCDTEYSLTSRTDYMALEASADGGSTFTEIDRRDEPYLDYPDTDPTGSAYAHLSYDLTGKYLTSNFKLRFRRVTNATDNAYDGCLIDDLTITKYTPGSTSYGNKDGTSMATPHVAGLASLAWSAAPTLSYSQIRNIIINSGDSISALSGKTVSGKRINVQNVLQAVGYSLPPAPYVRGVVTSVTSGFLTSTGTSFTILGVGLNTGGLAGTPPRDQITAYLSDSPSTGNLSGKPSTSGSLFPQPGWTGTITIGTTYQNFTGTTLYLHIYVKDNGGATVKGYGLQTITFLGSGGGGGFPGRGTIYGTIGASLSGQGIRNNFHLVTGDNATNFSGLYFAKMSGNDELGRISFFTGLDLTDTGTQNFLSGELPNAMGMQQGQIWFTPGTGFIGKAATLKMNIPDSYSGILGSFTANSFAVREGSGGALTGTSMISNIASGGSCTAGAFGCSLFLDVAHFTMFDIKPVLTQVHIQSNYSNPAYAASGYVVTLIATGSETLSGVTIKINGISVLASGGGVLRYATFTVTGGTASAPVTFSIDYSDMAGNTGATVTTTTDASSVTVNNTPPSTPTITTPATFTNGATIAINGAADAGNVVQIRSGATIIATGTSNGTFSITVPLVEGANIFQAYAVNLMGLISSGSASVTITGDTVAPTATGYFSPTGSTNGNVTATITGFSETVTGLNATGHIFTGNGTFLFTFTDLAGNAGVRTATVTRIDISPVTGSISYTPGSLTSGNVTASISFNKTGVTVTNNSGSTGYVFTNTGSFIFTFQDAAGNTGSTTASVTWIDKIAPTASVSYNISGATNQDVIATITGVAETITGTLTHTFTGNGSYLFTFTDLAGNAGSLTGTVTRIDTSPVTGSISYSTTGITNQNVTAFIAFNKTGVTVTNNGGSTGYVFTNTGSFTFIFQDAAGNTGSTTASVTRIDKIKPTASVTYTNSGSDVLATLTGYSESLTGMNALIHLFTSNGSFTFTFSDLAGNTGETVAIAVVSIVGTTISTGSTSIGGATSTGVVFTTTGTLQINSTGGSENNIQINVSGLIIQASGTWDGVILPPTDLSGGDSGNATTSELGLSSSTNTVLLTIQAGSQTAQLSASGGVGYFTISFIVDGGTNGNRIYLYRSTNGNTWTANTPDSYCDLGSDLVCTFRTDHLSYFAAIKQTTSNGGGGGGGGGLAMASKDECPDGDLSPSLYDGRCDKALLTGSIISSPFSKEFNDAYLFAYRYGITTMDTIQKANLSGKLIRAHLAKMMVQYAVKVLNLRPNTGTICTFDDIATETAEMRSYITLACQLGIMGINTRSFAPNREVTRAQFGTTLSRTLRGTRYNTASSMYYTRHLEALRNNGIISNTDPDLKEVRAYVMLMLMRSASK